LPSEVLQSLETRLDLRDNLRENFYFNALVLCPLMFVQSLPMFDTADIPLQCMNSVLPYTATTLVVSSNFHLPVLKVATFRNDYLR